MKTIGMIGGLGPESTIDYYQRIIEAFRVPGSLAAPEMVIYSVSLQEVMDLAARREWNHLVYLLLQKVRALHKAGADFAIITANTPHVVFDEVQAKSPIPLISIVAATCEKAKGLGVKKVGLLGTRFTMEENFFAPPFAAAGISVVVPSASEQHYIHEKLMTEIELGIIKDDTRKGLIDIIERLVLQEKVEAVILGCTELPLILKDGDFDTTFLNTTAIHVESVVRYCREGRTW
ncbi:amino acid racemase [Geomonas nitrogeniifigens]|uniref:aspartate/glutamate racemase family protein n=1 Tax=Geomonas diazotrophica TaxID=2843197 RepID=UPI001C2BDEA9|nr:amino acid racemase [Geomonas nitrogeniifigens]QXE85392.1 amino acid racemase [Geomonas nitrogeniifigens]